MFSVSIWGMFMSFRFNYKLLGRWALFTLILLVFYSVGWTNQMFGSISLDEVLLFFRDGVGGIDAGLVYDFVKHVVLWAIGWSVVLMMVCYFFRKYKYVPLVIYLLLFVFLLVDFRCCYWFLVCCCYWWFGG